MRKDVRVLTDEDIARMEAAERRALIARLARPLEDVVHDAAGLQRHRRVRIALTASAAVLLVPWTIYLAVSLPHVHQVRQWGSLWVGFDGIELLLLALTFWLAWERRVVGLLVAFATGVVLLCDAWFDLLTAAPGERWQSVAAAVVLEIPLALVLMSGAVQALRVVSAMLWFSDPKTRSWEIRLPDRWWRSRHVDEV